MKRPRVRFSIGGLMLLVLVVGAAIGIWREVRARQTPSAAELKALTAYRVAIMLRELSESMVGAYEQQASSLGQVERDLKRATELMGQVEAEPGMPVEPRKGDADPARPPAPPANPGFNLAALFSGQAQALTRQRAELKRLCADEAACRAAYERERAARLGWLGRWVKP